MSPFFQTVSNGGPRGIRRPSAIATVDTRQSPCTGVAHQPDRKPRIASTRRTGVQRGAYVKKVGAAGSFFRSSGGSPSSWPVPGIAGTAGDGTASSGGLVGGRSTSA